MRKLLIIFVMITLVMLFSCGTKCKIPTVAPTSGPTQEEVLQEAKTVHETGIFSIWWNKEMVLFRAYMMKQTGVPVVINTVETKFADNFDIAVVKVIMTIPPTTGSASFYVIIVRFGSEWKMNSLIRISEEEKNNEYEL